MINPSLVSRDYRILHIPACSGRRIGNPIFPNGDASANNVLVPSHR